MIYTLIVKAILGSFVKTSDPYRQTYTSEHGNCTSYKFKFQFLSSHVVDLINLIATIKYIKKNKKPSQTHFIRLYLVLKSIMNFLY